MKVLIACEESQAVCKAFRSRGYEAYSCDIQECSGGHPEWHIQGDAIAQAYSGKYDLMIGHPPCTYLSFAAMHVWNKPGRVFQRIDALMFFAKLWEAPIPFIALENPKGIASPVIATYSQEIQPYQFGDEAFKTTWLWLKGLPKLIHSSKNDLFGGNGIAKPQPHYIDSNGKKRHWTEANKGSKARSKTFPGIADAMAEQWGDYVRRHL